MIKIIEDPTLGEVARVWESRGLLQGTLPNSIDDLMTLESPSQVQQRILSVASVPSFTNNDIIEDISGVLREAFIPTLEKTIASLEKALSTEFSMILSGNVTGLGYDMELDNGDIHAMTAMLSLIKAFCHPLVAYEFQYDEQTMLGNIDYQFLQANPSFGTLLDDGDIHMKAAGEAFIKAIEQSQKSIISIQSETDDQSDDVIKKNQLGSDIQLAMEVLSMMKESLGGSAVDVHYILDTGEERTHKVNLGALFTNPIRDIRDIRVSFSLNLIPTIMW